MNDESFYNRGTGLSSRKTVNGDFKRLCKVILDGKAETIDMKGARYWLNCFSF